MTVSAKLSEQARRAAARSTKEILRRHGTELGMLMGCGFPKSGTVWLCQLLGTSLGLPYPRDYRMPIAMPAVIHGHWGYDQRFPKTAYIRRDGRDVIMSRYFYFVRVMGLPKKPARSQQLKDLFERLYGPNFDTGAVRANLPRFIEYQFTSSSGPDGLNWAQHVSDWWDRPHVAQVAYEELLNDPEDSLSRVVAELKGEECDPDVVSMSVARWAFATTSKRRPGQEDRTSFQRKGIAGDWMNYFTPEAAEIFDHYAGDALLELGYVDDRAWHTKLGS